MSENYKTCPRCHGLSPAAHVYCTKCGSLFTATMIHPSRQQSYPGNVTALSPYQLDYGILVAPTNCIRKAPGTHSVGAAAVLSVLVVGAGQCYNQQFAKGAAFFLANMLFGLCTHGASILVMWMVCSVEAAITASKINRGEWVSKW